MGRGERTASEMADEIRADAGEGGAGPSENGASAEPDGAAWLLKQIEETFGHITEEEWAAMNIPPDAAVQYKHYLYGTPKRPVPNLQSE